MNRISNEESDALCRVGLYGTKVQCTRGSGHDGNHSWADHPIAVAELNTKNFSPEETRMQKQQTKKQWHQLSSLEKHELWSTDEATARALRDAEPTFRGLTWEQMSDAERAECYRDDRETFKAMQEV
jgi:hypothetical protein